MWVLTAALAAEPLLLPNGDRYRGELQHGLFHGQGEYHFANGDRLTAEFDAGQPRQGTLETKHEHYQGAFLDWRFHGQGLLRDHITQIEFEGEFHQGELLEGQARYPGGMVFYGTFFNGQLQGPGQVLFANGTRFSGEFDMGKPLAGERVRIENGEEIRTEGVVENGRFIPLDRHLDKPARAQLNARLLAEHPQRLADALAAITPQQPGVQDVYYLVLGGDAEDSVFVREVDVVQQWLQRHVPAAQGIVLLNDRQFERYPLATVEAVRASLHALMDAMDPSEDVLFIHLASHGASGSGNLALTMPHLPLPSLEPAQVAEVLGEFPAVLVVSACFSGHWLDALKGENRLVWVSARRDRTSFGCGNDSAMTWFSKALYEDGKNVTDQPRRVFRRLKKTIRRWEKEEGITEYSEPQLWVGKQAPRWRHFREQFEAVSEDHTHP